MNVSLARLVLFFSFICLLGSCNNLHGTAHGRSVIVRIDTVHVNYDGSVSQPYK